MWWVSAGVAGWVYARESSKVVSALKGVGGEFNCSEASGNHCASTVSLMRDIWSIIIPGGD